MNCLPSAGRTFVRSAISCAAAHGLPNLRNESAECSLNLQYKQTDRASAAHTIRRGHQ